MEEADAEVPPPRPGGGADRLSALPDDMLLLVLARLRCARSAARTGVLSRRWRGLWAHLPDLTFRGVAPAQIEAALAGLAASPWVSNALDIEISPGHCGDDARLSSLQHAAATFSTEEPGYCGDDARLSSLLHAALLHAAARFSPQELLFSCQNDGYIQAALPCFPRATSIQIDWGGLICFTQLPAAEFQALEILSLKGCSIADLAALVTLCPRLRVLRVTASMPHFMVHSASLETLDVSSAVEWSSIDIVTPMLKHLKMQIDADMDLSISILAPMVEKLEWNCFFTQLTLVFGFWSLENMDFMPIDNHEDRDYWRKEDTCSQLRPVHVLHLDLSVPDPLYDELDFAKEVQVAQEMAKLPVADFSVLKLTLEMPGHVFGALVLRLFGLHQICAVTERLIVVIPFSHEQRQACPENCPCDEPKNWRCQSISLTRLEEVQIHGFTGEDHEYDFLKLIFRSSPMLNRVTLKLVPEFGGSIKEIYDTFSSNPSVKGCVYASNGGLVQQLSDEHAP
ncbi:uncharacterized protein LOC123449428 isoform X1 [Hordeum vulgare subsp. vulgare]|uniref:uncharacterized protein LOC123449428 isoform X1 n=1 Tax=Hordeum vulgare subsp. vulgare TaxID=112509 RepID=UPI001D1A3A87|nr:uncharacterized protein LOC123449428 isoform X1 [Hordeum vulgare subsp. vulgare]